MFNKVILVGNMVRDPEIKITASSLTICSFSLALNRKYKTKEGKYEEEVSFVNCTAFGPSGETISEHFAKGKAIMVEGRLKQSSWEDKEGQKKTSLGVIVEGWNFYGYKDDK
jgi:single-strand DNA-binding protein